MRNIGIRRLARLLLTLSIVGASLAAAAPASAARPVGVDFTIAETIPVSAPGIMVSSNIPDCSTASVQTTSVNSRTIGAVTLFAGTKVIDCGSGDSITLNFRAIVIGCATTDFGGWRAVSGTGVFDGVRGRGLLIGTYQGGDGTACTATGIDDRYIGRLHLAH